MAADTTTHSHPTTVSEPRDAAEDIRVALHRLSSSAPEEFFNIANDLRALGCDDAAVPFYEKAIEAGVPEATYNLALLRHERGRTEIARSGFVAASEAGDAKGAFMAAQIFEACGDDDRAALHYARALELPETPVRLARVLRRIGLAQEADDIVAESAAMSWESAVEHALRDATPVAEGLTHLDHHWSRGETRVAVTLALLLEEDGRADDAEAVLLVAAEAGDVQALTNLGTRWRDNGDLEAARRSLVDAALRGDALAQRLLEQHPA